MIGRTMSRPSSKSDRKARKSYTLSLRSVEFLETTKAQRRAASVSSVLEEILQAAQHEQERLSMGRYGLSNSLPILRKREGGQSSSSL